MLYGDLHADDARENALNGKAGRGAHHFDVENGALWCAYRTMRQYDIEIMTG
jgi:hypothetical protein